MIQVSHSVSETQHIAQKLAHDFLKENGDPIVVALEGELGAGKTTFTQAFAKELGIHESVKSPTFVLMKSYPIHQSGNYKELHHLDCYRLQNTHDLEPLGVAEKIVQPGTITLIEWAERVQELLPRNHWLIRLEHISEHERNISITHFE